MILVLIVLVTLLASLFGAICGIGGGVVIKPVLDSLGIMEVSTVSFLSGCTVLCMTLCSVGINLRTKSIPIRLKLSVPVSIGAAVGGILGKNGFQLLSGLFADSEFVGVVQSGCLFLLTFGTLLYTINKRKIHTGYTEQPAVCVVIGLLLGIFSSFLGIGGGPFNLVVLSFFFSMETKEAAQTSLFIILFSQITSLISTILSNRVPPTDWKILAGMCCMGVLGALLGRRINKRISAQTVDRLFMGMTVVIMGICIYNMFRMS